MNIAIINTNDTSGGAARASYRLHKGLRLLNEESAMIVKNKQSNDPNVHQVTTRGPEHFCEEQIPQAAQEFFINRNRNSISNTLFSLPHPGYDISNIDLIERADIINLHWINFFQSVETISSLLKLKKPVVWTLHDQWPFTGGCHYSSGCDKFVDACKNCPQLKEKSYEIPFIAHKHKIQKFNNKNLTIVTPSRWLANCVRRGKVFKNLRVEVIPNSVETDIFHPIPKEQAKATLNINPDIITLLFGSISAKEKRKGFKEIIKVISYCSRNEYFKELIESGKIYLLTFGKVDDEIKKIGIPIISFGYINSDEKLADIYSAADIFLLPSLEDNLPNTILESMSCGTPTVSFSVGGLPDLIQNGINGHMAPCFDIDKFGEMVLDLIKDSSKRKKMSICCRKSMEMNYQLKHQAFKYIELYLELLNNQKLNSNIKGFNYKKNDSRVIFLQEHDSSSIRDFYDTLNNFSSKTQNKINQMQNKIDSIYSSYTYRIGSLLIYPFKKIKNMFWF